MMSDADGSVEPRTEVSLKPGNCCCCKRCARKRKGNGHLPQEIVFDVLLHLPAQVLHNVMRHVCREWNLMIHSPDFILHHLHNSTGGIMIQRWDLPRHGIYVEMLRGRLEICGFDCGSENKVYNGCNGLVLFPDIKNRLILYVTNPLTKKRAALPPFHIALEYPQDWGLTYVEATREYKVVHAHGRIPGSLRTLVAILTIGVDKVWRSVEVEHLCPKARNALNFYPLTTGGYVHWICDNFILTLNVETEIISEFPRPQLSEKYCIFLPMGGTISLVYESGKFLCGVLEMNQETGEWTMLVTFDLKPVRSRFKRLLRKDMESVVPRGWLVAREVLVFSTRCQQGHCIGYNVKTKEIKSFELDTYASYNFQAHASSLVWLEGVV